MASNFAVLRAVQFADRLTGVSRLCRQMESPALWKQLSNTCSSGTIENDRKGTDANNGAAKTEEPFARNDEESKPVHHRPIPMPCGFCRLRHNYWENKGSHRVHHTADLVESESLRIENHSTETLALAIQRLVNKTANRRVLNPTDYSQSFSPNIIIQFRSHSNI
jgi:hypothetical protein